VSELVEPGVSGFVVRPLDARALARAVLQVTDPAVRTAMGARAHDRALSLCSTEQCAQLHLRAYDVAARHRDARLNGSRRGARTEMVKE
jgi:glycosyltransferase involved in cell wall biosynthesis